MKKQIYFLLAGVSSVILYLAFKKDCMNDALTELVKRCDSSIEISYF